MGGLGSGSRPMWAVLGEDQGLCGRSWVRIRAYVGSLARDQAGKWPKPERGQDPTGPGIRKGKDPNAPLAPLAGKAGKDPNAPKPSPNLFKIFLFVCELPIARPRRPYVKTVCLLVCLSPFSGNFLNMCLTSHTSKNLLVPLQVITSTCW